ncbi:hypothetical protein FKM82_001544 [Ascaphus truei]
MELAATKPTGAEDDLILILTQIKQYNQSVKNALEGSDFKNNEDLKELMFSLTFLIHDLSRTFCEKLSETTESLQSTFNLLKGLQNKFKNFDSNDESLIVCFVNAAHINYLITFNQLLCDTARHLKLVEEQLNNINTQYKDIGAQTQAANVVQNVTNNYDVDGSMNNKVFSNITQSFELQECTSKDKSEIASNAQDEETDHTLQMAKESSIRNANYAFHEVEKGDGSHQVVKHTENKDHKSKGEEQTETMMKKEDNQNHDLKVGKKHKEHCRTLDSGIVDRIELSNSEVYCKGTTLNLSVEHLLQSDSWTYKEYLFQMEGEKEQRLGCVIKAPSFILQQLQCRLLDNISSLVVSDSEELVSNVLGIWSLDADLKIPFPLSIAIPFNSRYRGNYKDVMVKENDEKLHSSYLTPISLEGYYGNHKGSFAEVKVYKLGIFSVVSCLKKESFTVLKKGLSLKLSMDSRISLNYPPGCFSSSVIVQFKPLDSVKHPSVQLFQKPATVSFHALLTQRRKKQGDNAENKRASVLQCQESQTAHQIRAISASVRKHGDNPSEFLKLLALKEDQWDVFDDIVVKNVQNGIVSFEVDEHLQRLIVIRLSSAMDNAHLISFIQSLEEATHSTMVNVVLYRKRDNLQKAIVEVVPSKELNWAILSLREEGYVGPPEPSEQIPLREGEQIDFRFCGNITASDGQDFGKTFKLIFHSQRKQRLSLNLRVVDEFGNYCSPHYKGTVAIYKLSREDIAANYQSDLNTYINVEERAPVCKLALTLPKMEKNISRPSSTKTISSNPTDILWSNLLHWLAQELSEEDASLLVLSLPIRRSTIQLVKLKSPESLTDQIYELLSFWKKSLPTSADKLRLLARHLRKSGRSDLLEQLKFKWENKVFIPATKV